MRYLRLAAFLFITTACAAQVMQIGVSNIKSQSAVTPISFVNSLTEGIGGTGGTSSAVDMTGASLCTVSISWYSGGFAPDLTSSPANTWLLAVEHGAGGGGGSGATSTLYYAYSPTVSNMMTFTLSSLANSYPSISANCFANTVGSMVDQVNGVDVTSTTSPQQTGSVTPSTNGQVIITSIDDFGGSDYAINSSFTTPEFVAYVPATYMGQASSYLIQGAAAAVNPTWTWTGTNVVTGAVVIATFK